MSDDSSRTKPVGPDNIRATLDAQGYALINDQIIGLPTKFRENFLRRYFNDRVLRHDEGDWPQDRKRARDVIGYQWRDGHLRMREHETITITDRAGIAGKRDHKRVWLLDDPEVKALVDTFLSLVPTNRRPREGTFGVNLFSTFTNVVTKAHRDYEEFVILYVLQRAGDGAQSYLYNASDVPTDGQPTAEPALRHQLDQGEILIFDDERFVHDASPLLSLPGVETRRDVLVCTVDYPTTYLEPNGMA